MRQVLTSSQSGILIFPLDKPYSSIGFLAEREIFIVNTWLIKFLLKMYLMEMLNWWTIWICYLSDVLETTFLRNLQNWKFGIKQLFLRHKTKYVFCFWKRYVITNKCRVLEEACMFFFIFFKQTIKSQGFGFKRHGKWRKLSPNIRYLV